MPKKVVPLSDNEIKNLKSRNKNYEVADGEGLYVRIHVAKDGQKPTKSWIFRYRKLNGKTTNITVGRYPQITLSKAREIRAGYMVLLAENVDPRENKSLEKLALGNSLESVSRDWLKLKKITVTTKTYQGTVGRLENYVFTDVGDKPIAQISAPMMISVLTHLSEAGNLGVLKKICVTLNQIMTYAENTGLIEVNRISKISNAFPAPKSKHFPSIGRERIPELLSDLQYAAITAQTRILILFELHTMVRPNEAAGAKWSEIDFDECLWSIPQGRMKKDRPHNVPLTHQVLELLKRMKEMHEHTDFVFPSIRSYEKQTNAATANMAIKRMGYKGKLVAHGLRSIASSVLNEVGFNCDLIEFQLAHVDKNQVRSAYNRTTYLNRRRKMLEWWSDFLDENLAAGLTGNPVIVPDLPEGVFEL